MKNSDTDSLDGFVYLEDESEVDWSRVHLPKRLFKAVQKDAKRAELERMRDFAERSTKYGDQADDAEGMLFSRDEVEICKNFGQLEPHDGSNRLADNIRDIIFRPMCPTFLERLGILVNDIQFRQENAAVDFLVKRLNKLGQLKSIFHEQTKLVRDQIRHLKGNSVRYALRSFIQQLDGRLAGSTKLQVKLLDSHLTMDILNRECVRQHWETSIEHSRMVLAQYCFKVAELVATLCIIEKDFEAAKVSQIVELVSLFDSMEDRFLILKAISTRELFISRVFKPPALLTANSFRAFRLMFGPEERRLFKFIAQGKEIFASVPADKVWDFTLFETT